MRNGGRTLEISAVQTAGRYTCIVANGYGTDSAEIDVSIAGTWDLLSVLLEEIHHESVQVYQNLVDRHDRNDWPITMALNAE